MRRRQVLVVKPVAVAKKWGIFDRRDRILRHRQYQRETISARSEPTNWRRSMKRKLHRRMFSGRTIADAPGSASESGGSRRVRRPPEAAKYLSLSPHTLAKQRLRGDGPPFVKLGPKAVGYLQSHLDAWLRARIRRSTCQRVATNKAASNSPAYRRRARLSHVTLRREP